MAVSVQVVNFTKETSGTPGVTQDVNLNFTPKAIRVISNGDTANDTAAANYMYCEGMSDGTNHACLTGTSRDNTPAGAGSRIHRQDAVLVIQTTAASPPNAVVVQGTCSFSTNKVTFTWGTNTTSAYRIKLIAFGGDDITNTKVLNTTINIAAPGNQDYTGLGFTVTDDNGVAFQLHGARTADTGAAPLDFTVGTAVSPSKRWTIGQMSENTADPTDTWRSHFTDQFLSLHSTADGTVAYNADFNSWISDGLRLTWIGTGLASTVFISFLVIKGGKWDCGTLTSPAANTLDSDTTVSVGSSTLRGIMLSTASLPSASLGATQTVTEMSTGFADTTPTQGTVGAIDEDAQATADNYRISNGSNILKGITTNGAAETVVTFDSFPTTSSFRLDYGTITTGTQISWVVVADTNPSETFPHSYGKINTMFDNNSGPAIFG